MSPFFKVVHSNQKIWIFKSIILLKWTLEKLTMHRNKNWVFNISPFLFSKYHLLQYFPVASQRHLNLSAWHLRLSTAGQDSDLQPQAVLILSHELLWDPCHSSLLMFFLLSYLSVTWRPFILESVCPISVMGNLSLQHPVLLWHSLSLLNWLALLGDFSAIPYSIGLPRNCISLVSLTQI